MAFPLLVEIPKQACEGVLDYYLNYLNPQRRDEAFYTETTIVRLCPPPAVSHPFPTAEAGSFAAATAFAAM